MRPFVFGAIGLVIGVFIGGIPSEGRISKLEDRVTELSGVKCDDVGFAGAVTGMLQGAGRPRAEAPMAEADTDAPEAAAPPRDEPFHRRRDLRMKQQGDTDAGPPDFEAAKEALEARRAQARAALIERTGADEEQMAQIDATTAQMNADLASLTDDFLADADKNGPPTRRDAMVYASEALDSLITAEDNMKSALTEDQRAAVDDEVLDPTSFIDPALVDKFQALKDRQEQR